MVERVVVGRNAIAHACQSHGVQPHQRNRKPTPPLFLELGQHRLLGNNQNPLATAALDELSRQNACFQRLTQTYGIGNQDTGSWLPQCLQCGIQLVWHQVHHAPVAQVDAVIVSYAAATLTFQIQQCGVVGGAFIGDQCSG